MLQVADLVFPILDPDWTLQFVLMLSLLGFPIAIVLGQPPSSGSTRLGSIAPVFGFSQHQQSSCRRRTSSIMLS